MKRYRLVLFYLRLTMPKGPSEIGFLISSCNIKKDTTTFRNIVVSNRTKKIGNIQNLFTKELKYQLNFSLVWRAA
jgi:hypothetical protein